MYPVYIGETVAVVLPWSEVCIHMRVADRVMPVRIDEREAILLKDDGTHFSRVTHGEAGIMIGNNGQLYLEDHASGPNLRIHTVRYLPTEDGDRKVIGEETESVACLPNTDHAELGITNSVAYAAHYLRDHLYISGPYAASSYPAQWHAGTWFSTEVYEDPYGRYYEETTVHPAGFTPEQGAELIRLVCEK